MKFREKFTLLLLLTQLIPVFLAPMETADPNPTLQKTLQEFSDAYVGFVYHPEYEAMDALIRVTKDICSLSNEISHTSELINFLPTSLLPASTEQSQSFNRALKEACEDFLYSHKSVRNEPTVLATWPYRITITRPKNLHEISQTFVLELLSSFSESENEIIEMTLLYTQLYKQAIDILDALYIYRNLYHDVMRKFSQREGLQSEPELALPAHLALWTANQIDTLSKNNNTIEVFIRQLELISYILARRTLRPSSQYQLNGDIAQAYDYLNGHSQNVTIDPPWQQACTQFLQGDLGLQAPQYAQTLSEQENAFLVTIEEAARSRGY
jgi:hypothetical protein